MLACCATHTRTLRGRAYSLAVKLAADTNHAKTCYACNTSTGHHAFRDFGMVIPKSTMPSAGKNGVGEKSAAAAMFAELSHGSRAVPSRIVWAKRPRLPGLSMWKFTEKAPEE